MSVFTKDIVIPPDRKITIELPENIPTGHVTITFVVDPTPPPDKYSEKGGIASLYGEGKGQVWMSDDFNEPLEDFAEVYVIRFLFQI